MIGERNWNLLPCVVGKQLSVRIHDAPDSLSVALDLWHWYW